MINPLERKEAERYIARVDEWVQHFHKGDGDETLSEQAYESLWKTPNENTETSLGSEFFRAIHEYDQAKAEHSNHDEPLRLRIHYDAARLVQICLDRARIFGLLQPNESVGRKFADCIQKKNELEKQLQQAHQRIVELENFVRLIGGDPSKASDTFTGDVKKGGAFHE